MTGEVLTRTTIWVSFAGYVAGAALLALSRDRAARIAWTLGCLGLLAHTLVAFHVHHAWSHAAAYRATARRTAELFGLDWGGGLYFNYAMLAGWSADAVAWWWTDRRRRGLWAAAWQGFLFFMFFNGLVVFARGATRWIGLSALAGLVLLWLGTRRER
ncbi:MAG TPA: hypothetical protein VJS92_11670 [Candidatus Polarisedimenticolaceae bacterium]|nr:hypothetical protein [Candidatus Polarisedimenticolaceae bacterium]